MTNQKEQSFEVISNFRIFELSLTRMLSSFLETGNYFYRFMYGKLCGFPILLFKTVNYLFVDILHFALQNKKAENTFESISL